MRRARGPRVGGFEATGLLLSRLRITFGGTIAVADATVMAPIGGITGLIGPNGAGKTSILNAANGLLKPSGGAIHVFGTDVTGDGTAARARAGLGRTFQTTELCTAMTVRENVAVGAEARLAGANPLGHVVCGARHRRTVAEATEQAIRTCRLTGLADRSAANLSTGHRRLLELARVLAGGYRLLLLDEPSSGLDDRETYHFGQILAAIVAGGRCGILLVEHDMNLVMSVCDYIYVLDFGHVIFEGSPAETQASPAVRAAYLGTDGHVASGTGW